MKFPTFLFVSGLFLIGCASDDDSDLLIEPVVYAYDTLEYRYQQLSELAIDLMANISMDPDISVNQVSDLLDEEPVVSLDFRKLPATKKDIMNFIAYQRRIDEGLQDIFEQLDNAPKWRSAPLILDVRGKYEALSDSIRMATDKFNTSVKEAKLAIAIPVDSTVTK